MSADRRRKAMTLIERAVKTLDALPDPEARFRRYRTTVWPTVPLDPMDAYNQTELPDRFRPTPQDVSNHLIVWDWLTWLDKTQNMGSRDLKIIRARAYGAPWWRLASRFGRDPRTVKRWHDRAIDAIVAMFREEIAKM